MKKYIFIVALLCLSGCDINRGAEGWNRSPQEIADYYRVPLMVVKDHESDYRNQYSRDFEAQEEKEAWAEYNRTHAK